MSPVFAGSESPFTAVTAELGLGNDNITGGLSRNDDDFRTFGIYANVFWKDYTFFSRFDSFTFKDYGYRYDILTVGAKKNFVFDNLYVVNASLGLQLKGPLGGEFMQNTIHKLFNIALLYLEYEPSQLHFSAEAGVEAYMDKRFSPYIAARTGFDWRAEAGVRLRMDEFSVATLTYSYDVFSRHGLNLSIDADNGFMRTTYTTNFLDRYGYGCTYINPFKPLKGNGNTVGGAIYMTGHTFSYSMIEMRFGFAEKFTAFLNIKFATGSLNKNPNYRLDDNIYGIGAGYRVIDRLELRAYGGAHLVEKRLNHVISSSLTPVAGADFRFKCFEAFNAGINAEGGVMWDKQFYLYGGLSLVF